MAPRPSIRYKHSIWSSLDGRICPSLARSWIAKQWMRWLLIGIHLEIDTHHFHDQVSANCTFFCRLLEARILREKLRKKNNWEIHRSEQDTALNSPYNLLRNRHAREHCRMLCPVMLFRKSSKWSSSYDINCPLLGMLDRHRSLYRRTYDKCQNIPPDPRSVPFLLRVDASTLRLFVRPPNDQLDAVVSRCMAIVISMEAIFLVERLISFQLKYPKWRPQLWHSLTWATTQLWWRRWDRCCLLRWCSAPQLQLCGSIWCQLLLLLQRLQIFTRQLHASAGRANDWIVDRWHTLRLHVLRTAGRSCRRCCYCQFRRITNRWNSCHCGQFRYRLRNRSRHTNVIGPIEIFNVIWVHRHVHRMRKIGLKWSAIKMLINFYLMCELKWPTNWAVYVAIAGFFSLAAVKLFREFWYCTLRATSGEALSAEDMEWFGDSWWYFCDKINCGWTYVPDVSFWCCNWADFFGNNGGGDGGTELLARCPECIKQNLC